MKELLINPNKVYPLISIESINPRTLETVKDRMKTERYQPMARGVIFEDDLFVTEGVYEVLAAGILKIEKILFFVLDESEDKYWNDRSNIITQLNAIGKNALFDFEAIGGFKYDKYPKYY